MGKVFGGIVMGSMVTIARLTGVQLGGACNCIQ